MNERNEPNEIVLSPHERLTLRHIEAGLSVDRRLVRRMGRRGGPRPWRWPAVSVALLTCASLFFAIMGIRTSDPVFIWSFAGVWPFTLLQAFRLLCRVSRSGERFTAWL